MPVQRSATEAVKKESQRKAAEQKRLLEEEEQKKKEEMAKLEAERAEQEISSASSDFCEVAKT